VAAVDSPPPTTLKILRTMSLRTFRMKILKTFKAPRGAKARLWLSMADNSLAEVDVGQDDTGDLTWWGLEDGAQVFLFVDS
jgi:tubulin-specific chaperone E